MLRAAIYARVSSQMQRDAQTIESQLRTLPAYVKAQGWQLVETYIDDGKSAKTGRLERRDGFAKLMRDAEAKRFDVVVVVDVNRLTRTESIEERAQILGPLQRLGIQVATPSGGILDLRSFMGEFWVTMQALMAAQENAKRAEATRRGQAHRARLGGKPRGRTPYGLAYNTESREWSLHPEHIKRVREIFRRVIKGESCIAIAYDFNARSVPAPAKMWHAWTVRRIVIARYPVGEWTAHAGQRLVVRVPAAIDEATWQRAQTAIVNTKLRGLRRTKHFDLLEAIATCGECGRRIVIHRARSGFYYCKGRRRRVPGEKICTAKPASIPEIDESVWAAVVREIESPRRARQLSERNRASEIDVTKHRANLARFIKAEQTFMERYSRGLITDESLDAGLEKLRKDRARVEEELRAAQGVGGNNQPSPEEYLFALRKAARAGTAEGRQRVVRSVVLRAVLVGGSVRLTMRLGVGQAGRSCPRTHSEATVEIRVVA